MCVREDHRVRLHVCHHAPGKAQGLPLVSRRLAPGDDLEAFRRPGHVRLDDLIALLHEQGAENGAIFAAAERAEMDVRPGGIFSIDIATADGKDAPNLGCFLDVVPMERLAWTSMLFPGYRPAVFDDSPITAIVTMEAVPVARCWGGRSDRREADRAGQPAYFAARRIFAMALPFASSSTSLSR